MNSAITKDLSSKLLTWNYKFYITRPLNTYHYKIATGILNFLTSHGHKKPYDMRNVCIKVYKLCMHTLTYIATTQSRHCRDPAHADSQWHP